MVGKITDKWQITWHTKTGFVRTGVVVVSAFSLDEALRHLSNELGPNIQVTMAVEL